MSALLRTCTCTVFTPAPLGNVIAAVAAYGTHGSVLATPSAATRMSRMPVWASLGARSAASRPACSPTAGRPASITIEPVGPVVSR